MLVVSACLAGIPCRMDGKAKPIPTIQKLVAEGKAVPVCPEVLGGLPTPRIPSERRGARVINQAGEDVTDAFLQLHPEMKREAFELPEPFGAADDGQRTIWPFEFETDGFYLCRMRKRT